LQQWLGQLQPESGVWLNMPKFKVMAQFQLQDVLGWMGMRQAFGPAADFSGMTGRRELFISDVIHQAWVSVDEEGTETAAATAVMESPIDKVPPPSPIFRADHPFVFLVRDNRSGAILFMGRVTDPSR
jgi:serpin B